MTLGCGNLFAQNDGFFTSSYMEYREGRNEEWGIKMPLLPGSHGYLGDYDCVEPAPLGSGLFILASLGFAYTISRRKEK